jgi:hypothetical protein
LWVQAVHRNGDDLVQQVRVERLGEVQQMRRGGLHDDSDANVGMGKGPKLLRECVSAFVGMLVK